MKSAALSLVLLGFAACQQCSMCCFVSQRERGIAVVHYLQMCRYLNLPSHQAEQPPEPREVHRRLRKTILRDESWVSAAQFMPFAPGKHLLVSSLALTGKQKTISCCSLSASSASSSQFPPVVPYQVSHLGGMES